MRRPGQIRDHRLGHDCSLRWEPYRGEIEPLMQFVQGALPGDTVSLCGKVIGRVVSNRIVASPFAVVHLIKPPEKLGFFS